MKKRIIATLALALVLGTGSAASAAPFDSTADGGMTTTGVACCRQIV